MGSSEQKGFILPVFLVIVALTATVGVWYTSSKDKDVLTKTEKDSLVLDVATQIGVSKSQLSFIRSNQRYVRFEDEITKKSIFAKRSGDTWEIIKEKDGYNSCEQLSARGFPSSFLYDCKLKYKDLTFADLMTDNESRSVVVGVIVKTDTCDTCVKLVNNQKETIEFSLRGDFDDGDYVAVSIPDDAIISINDNPVSTDEENSLDNTLTIGDQNTDDTDTTQGIDSEPEIVVEATIIENIVNAEDIEQAVEDESSVSSNNTLEDDTPTSGSSSNESSDDSNIDTTRSVPGTVDPNNSQTTTTVFDDPAEDQVDSSIPLDERETIFKDDQEVVNFFDIDRDGQGFQVIGDPSEDRSEQ